LAKEAFTLATEACTLPEEAFTLAMEACTPAVEDHKL
jgi:hypothetical protein